MFKIRSIQKKLFFSHIVLILAFALVSGVIFFFYTSSIIRNNVLGTYSSMVKSTSAQLDIMLHDMDNLSRNILFSRVYYDRDMFYYIQESTDIIGVPNTQANYMSDYFFAHPYKKLSVEFTNLYNTLKDRNIVNVINSINGPETRCKEIVMFDSDGNLFCAPDKTSIAREEVRQKVSSIGWIKDVYSRNGSKKIIPPHDSDWNKDNGFLFSLVRSFSDTQSHTNKGIIEVQQDYSKLESVINLVTGDSHGSIYVIDDDGNMIFPVNNSQSVKRDTCKYLTDSTANKGTGRKYVLNPNTHKHETILYNHSEYSGWTTFYAISDNTLYSEANKFRIWFLSVLVLILAVTVVLSYFSSRSITYPMKLLHKLIKKTDLTNLLKDSSDQKLEETVKEVSEVYKAFNDVRMRLNKAMFENIEARSKEAKAHWMALQAQMNPHFLYNTLSVIEVTSEDGDTASVAFMCRKLSQMLKYVTRFTDFKTTIKYELDYVINYLELMKVRYEEHLFYTTDLPESMMEITLPKLVLQPLVENCINHGLRNSRPPWKILISGRIDGNRWELTVADNGCGIEKNKIEAISDEVIGYDIMNSMENDDCEKENGLGLTNTLIRLKLMYREQLYFKMENNEYGGFSITFGGSI